jgi:hypothetical protein
MNLIIDLGGVRDSASDLLAQDSVTPLSQPMDKSLHSGNPDA